MGTFLKLQCIEHCLLIDVQDVSLLTLPFYLKGTVLLRIVLHSNQWAFIITMIKCCGYVSLHSGNHNTVSNKMTQQSEQCINNKSNITKICA